jgi:hypothetical protein
VVGRLLSRWHGRDQAEAELRDGLHGALVWALGIALGAALAFAAGGALLRAGAEVGARAAAAIGATVDPVDLALDAMLRPAAGGTTPGRAETSASDARAELSRLLTRTVAAGTISDQDRTYLTQRIAQMTGLPQQEADSRLNAAIVEARRAADKARRAAVLTGLVTATSLLASLAAAWWAAVKGGQDRDKGLTPGLGRRRGIAPGT